MWLNGDVRGRRRLHALIDGTCAISNTAASLRAKAIRDIVGVLVFLLPFCTVVAIWGLPFVGSQWSLEASESGRHARLFILKGFTGVRRAGRPAGARDARTRWCSAAANGLPVQFRYRPE